VVWCGVVVASSSGRHGRHRHRCTIFVCSTKSLGVPHQWVSTIRHGIELIIRVADGGGPMCGDCIIIRPLSDESMAGMDGTGVLTREYSKVSEVRQHVTHQLTRHPWPR
jgi:hypothetical protein